MNQRLYEPCLCGSGKKMKFCCPDLVADWEKIHRLIEADQPVGALEHLNRVIDQRRRQGKSDNPALLTERITILRKLRRDQWREEADQLFASFPDDARAVALQGIKLLSPETSPGQDGAVSSEEMLRAAMDRWLTARELSTEPSREWFSLTLMLAETMVDHEWIRPAAFILMIVSSSGIVPEWVVRLYTEIQSDESIPLALRAGAFLGSWPEVKQSPPLEAAYSKLVDFDWRRAERELAELVASGDAPVTAWRVLAEARLLLGKIDEACAALRTYIEKWPSSADVFEAELLLLSIGPKDQLGWVPLNQREWNVLDIDRVQEALISDSRCIAMDPSAFDRIASEIRPRFASQIYQSGPLPEDAELTSAEEAPQAIGHLLLFGKQTDRDAKLVLYQFGERIEQSAAVVQQLCGDLIVEIPIENGGWRSWLRTELEQAFRWPKNLSLPRFRELTMAHAREVLLRRWPNRSFECLGGRTFFEAAADPSLRMRLLALIHLEESDSGMERYSPLFDELRSQLGVLTPMEDGRANSMKFASLMSRYLSSDAISDNELIRLILLADGYQNKALFGHLAPMFLRRESLRNHEMADFVCQNLILLLADRDEAAEWIEWAEKNLAQQDGGKAAWRWSLLKAHWHLRRGDNPRVIETMQKEIQPDQIDPKDFQAFLSMAYSLGLISPEMLGGTASADEPMVSQEPAGLWTPDSAAPPAAGGGKLWVPD